MKIRFVLSSMALGPLLAWTMATSLPDCVSGDLHFACPQGFKPVPLDSVQPFSFFHYKKYEVGLFIASPPQGFDERAFMANITKTTLAKMFPKESQKFSWKPVAFSDSFSKFEVGGGMVLGFNGSLAVLIKYRHLKLNGREIIVGYTSQFGRSAQGKEAFEQGLGGDSMPGCYATVDVIYSITGEKVAESNPCDIVGTIG
jgi:hypothetical protein